ncbi:hypothetical protein NW762_014258 [Fusarium torreyae]|uniref:Uncharacterized protein n=1 Tax=Fusarium torreyae TaxID=1237075 RepID=A0A9W8RJ72_9HYPO|nr:hypothetical protein NW762_014258 [Fusarium torreyae]
MPALPQTNPRDMAIGARDATTSLLFSRGFDVWDYEYDDDDDHRHHGDDDDHWWDDHRHRRLSKEMIAVIVAAVVLIIAIVSLVTFCVTRKRRSRHGYHQTVDSAPLMTAPPDMGQQYHGYSPQPPNNAYTAPAMDTGMGYAGAGPEYLLYGEGPRDLSTPPPYGNVQK